MKEKLNGPQIFEDRTIVIATMHEKEKVIAPLLEAELGVKCDTISSLDTDSFGTFSGDIARVHTALDTARLKALAGLDLCDETLGIASEGSFGPHPSSPFMSANEELVILVDIKNKLEVVGRHFTLKTNFSHREIKNINDLEDFLKIIGYPDHAVIVKISYDDLTIIHKNFKSKDDLYDMVINALENCYGIEVETDMRAMNNPTRMEAIEHAVLDLINNIKSVCPKCQSPGFVIKEVIRGLPCELCYLPTKSAKAFKYFCQQCEFSEERLKQGMTSEDPMFCDYCNP